MGSGNPGVPSGAPDGTPGAPLLLPGVLRPREGVCVVGGGPLAEVEAVHTVDPRGRGAGAVAVAVVAAQGLAAPEKEGSGINTQIQNELYAQ